MPTADEIAYHEHAPGKTLAEFSAEQKAAMDQILAMLQPVTKLTPEEARRQFARQAAAVTANALGADDYDA